MQCLAMWTVVALGLVVSAAASEAGPEQPTASNATSRAVSSDGGQLLQTVDRLLTAALGPAGRATPAAAGLQDLLATVPFKLAGLKAALVAAAPGIAIAGLVIAIIALAKVGALYKKLGLSVLDTIHEAVPKFGLPGHGFPEHGEYDGYGRYDPTEYAYHEDGYGGGESSYAGYASRRGHGAGDEERSSGGRPSAQARLDRPADSGVLRRTPPAAPLPLAWS